MKTKLFGFLLFFIICKGVFAQNKFDNIDITYGEELADDKQKIIRIIGENNNKIYALVITGTDVFFLKIFESKSMKMISSNEIIIPKLDDREINFEEIYMLNGNIYAIGSVFNKNEKTYNLVATQISEEGVLSQNTILLFSSDVAKNSNSGSFYYKLSQDGGALLIMHTSFFFKDSEVHYELKLFDDKLITLFSDLEVVKFDDNRKNYQFTVSDFELNYQDDVFLVINESYRDVELKQKIEKFQVHEFKRANNYKKEVIDINFNDKEIINCKMISTSKNTLKLVGFYASVRENGKSNGGLKGIYNFTIDLMTNTTESLVFNDFDYDTKVKLIGERRTQKGKDLNPFYSIQFIVEKDDGGLIILSEYQSTTQGASVGLGLLSVSSTNYHKNEVIITSLKPDGTLEWSNVLPKEQLVSITTLWASPTFMFGGGSFSVGMTLNIPFAALGKGPEYLGIIPVYKNGEMIIIFNDNVKNKGVTSMDEIKSMTDYNDAVPAVFIYDNKGNVVRKDPEEAAKNEVVIRPAVCFRKSENELILYASRKKKDKLGRLIFKD